MKRRMQGRKYIIIICLMSMLSLMAQDLCAQVRSVDSLVVRGDRLRNEYRFDESVEAYFNAMEMEIDSVKRSHIADKMLMAENGKSMTGFVYSPVVVARHRFSVKEFFLYYPLRDSSWRAVPNQLDSSSVHPYAQAIYAPDDEEIIYFSAEDSDGIRNIYMTQLRDSLWTRPALLNEEMTSYGDEVYPTVSADGKAMYFASNGLYGVGGYDIYVSYWDETMSDWSAPVNMGFPYSSPADDFLFVNSEDGRYTMFASNRACSKDSVFVYVFDYEPVPVRKEMTDPHQLLELSKLKPVENVKRMNDATVVRADISENAETKMYKEKSLQIRALRDSVSVYEAQITSDRDRLSKSTNPTERQNLTYSLLLKEKRSLELRAMLDRTVAERQEMELLFLMSGMDVDSAKLLEEAERESIGELTSYVFTRMNMGSDLDLDMVKPAPVVEKPVVEESTPEPKFDYTFKILPQGQFAEDNTIPADVIYQIQIFSTTHKAKVKDLKGLSPVFLRKTESGRYNYRVGAFTTYNEVLSNLNKVKKVGFRTAFIVAYIDGKEVKVSKARAREAELEKEKEMQIKIEYLYDVRIYPEGGELDPVVLDGIIQQAAGKDIAKSEDERGALVYVIGPYSDEVKAQSLVDFIQAMGGGKVVLRKTPKTPVESL